MMTETSESFTHIVRQATETFQSALQTGARFQQEAIKTILQPVNTNENYDEFKNRTRKVSDATLKFFQKNMDESQKLMDTQCRQSIDLLRKAFDVAKPADSTELFDATRTLWQDSFDAMRNSMEQISRTNAQVVENFTQLMTVPFNGHDNKKTPAKA